MLDINKYYLFDLISQISYNNSSNTEIMLFLGLMNSVKCSKEQLTCCGILKKFHNSVKQVQLRKPHFSTPKTGVEKSTKNVILEVIT